jgi:hypothetical protein
MKQSLCWCEIPISHPNVQEPLPASQSTGWESRWLACENGFSHERRRPRCLAQSNSWLILPIGGHRRIDKLLQLGRVLIRIHESASVVFAGRFHELLGGGRSVVECSTIPDGDE